MTITVPGGDLQSGVVWDYLRLELADNQLAISRLDWGVFAAGPGGTPEISPAPSAGFTVPKILPS